MKFHGEARFSRNDDSGYFRRNRIVCGSAASTASTAEYAALRSDFTPAGGLMILSYEALTSLEVISLPSWNFTPRCSLNV
jgi:hypothetical protein